MAATGHRETARRLIVHMGVQKTASTAFHHFLVQNRASIWPQLEFHAPKQGTPTQIMGRKSVDFTLDPTPAREAEFVSAIRAVRDEIAGGERPCLISHENLPGAMPGCGATVTLYPHLERILALLDENLAPLRPHFVFYTREIASWKKSVHNQAVKTDGYPSDFPTFLAETADCGDWAGLEARVKQAVGADRVTFLPLEAETPDRPGEALLKLCGLDDATLAALAPLATRPNESLNAGSLEFMRRLNGLDLNPPARHKIMKLVIASQELFQAPAQGTAAR